MGVELVSHGLGGVCASQTNIMNEVLEVRNGKML